MLGTMDAASSPDTIEELTAARAEMTAADAEALDVSGSAAAS